MIKESSRESTIVKTSYVGIGINILLALFKAVVGLLANSIAIVLDAINNLSDALSSLITIIGTKLANKPADKGHPYGHGRIEYFSAVIIAFIVLGAGVASLVESVKKIINPGPSEYTFISISIIAIAVVVKLLLGKHVMKVGKSVNSGALTASGADALFDAVISTATLISALVMMIWGISVDAWLGGLISIVIIKAGINMTLKPINELLGKRIDTKLTKSIKVDVASIEGVQGAYDLLLHNYGPEEMVGSVHIEVEDTMSASDIYNITKNIQHKIREKYNIFLTVGIYAINSKDKTALDMQKQMRAVIAKYKNIMQMHGLYIDRELKIIQFDILVSFIEKDALKLRQKVITDINEIFPGYEIEINIDRDITD
ncbi:cation diffusion facilitator family transporter [Prevotella sp.]|uniref:cation diffusion facilitator family transporter n=1 Tax=Prevotella sp. TaxID=59823 RepID=UPI0026494788|nr:cation diffusion facilitator family transporter [Prevotella sp.]MDN5552741.1 cation diffusion facilitator family transporter [Prevotella sp.]